MSLPKPNFGLFNGNKGGWIMEDYWVWIFYNSTWEDLEAVLIGCWAIWNKRNNITFKGEQNNLEVFLEQATRYILENISRKTTYTLNSGFGIIQSSGTKTVSRWVPSPLRTWVLNVDAF